MRDSADGLQDERINGSLTAQRPMKNRRAKRSGAKPHAGRARTGRRLIGIKRVYDEPTPADGLRILVDRLWPRGVSKAAAKLDAWPRDLAPSTGLRVWYGHDPQRYAEFRRRYREEI